MGSSGAPPTVGVAVVGAQGPFRGRNNADFYEVCRAYGHLSQMFPILHKYSNVSNINYYKFYALTTHHIDQCRVLDALVERLDKSMFKVNEAEEMEVEEEWEEEGP